MKLSRTVLSRTLDRSFRRWALPLTALAATLALPVHAAYLFEIDQDATDDGILTYHLRFAFGGDTTTATQSGTSPAVGTSGGDSIFGGDGGAVPDTYVYRYAPDTEADNLVLAPGTDLGEENVASGVTGGAPGVYAVYATWPFTDIVSGGPTRYVVETSGDGFTVDLNQNDADDPLGNDGRGGEWALLGYLNYTSGDIRVTQTPTLSNTFVSQRAYGLLFERNSNGVLFVDRFESGDTSAWSSSQGE